MKLNTDCVRALLLALEEVLQFDENLTYPHIRFARLSENSLLQEYSNEDIAYTTLKLIEADFIDADTIPGDNAFNALYSSITYEGHQFLEGIRKEENWKQTKSICGKVGNFALQSIMSVAEGVTTAAINKHFGF
jgi:hypothetical protein